MTPRTSIHPRALPRAIAASLALGLFGCLSPDKGGHSFEVGAHSPLSTQYAYDPAGNRGEALGIGADTRGAWIMGEGNPASLYLFEASEDPWSSFRAEDDLSKDRLLLDEDTLLPVSNVQALQITPDSTKVQRWEVTRGLTTTFEWKTVASYAGHPCTFSRPRGSVWKAELGAWPVEIRSLRILRIDGHMRLSMVIDTAATPWIEFRDSSLSFYGSARVSCP